MDVGEKELWDLVHQHKVPSHAIAGAFLRFKKEDIEELKIKWRIERELFPEPSASFVHRSTVKNTLGLDRIKDFWYFNDFYMICSALIVALLYLIIASQ